MVRAKCPKCAVVLEFTTEQPGQTIKCVCGTKLRCPRPTAMVKATAKPLARTQSSAIAGASITDEKPRAVARIPGLAVSKLGEWRANRSIEKAHQRELKRLALEVRRLELLSISASPPKSTQTASATPQIAAPMTHPTVQQIVNVHVGQNQPRWNRGVAMVLSFLIPGAGQIYKGQPINGVAWLVVTAGGYCLFVLPGAALHICCVLGAAMGDPYR